MMEVLTKPFTPVWIYSNDRMDQNAEDELCDLLAGMIEKNRAVHIIARSELKSSVLRRLSESLKVEFEEYMPMNVYACHNVKAVDEIGHLELPGAQYKVQMAELVKQMSLDAENHELSDAEANGFAEANEHSETLFLWKDIDIVAMARIAHKNEKYARINTVVTDRKHRGHGYAKMLVGSISKELLEQGIIPMLYADARNPASNAAYLRIGFEKVGEIAEFRVR